MVLLPAWFTVCPLLNVPVLPVCTPSPLYVAVMALLPSGKPAVVQVAVLVLAFTTVTAVVPQPVSVLHVTVPPMLSETAAPRRTDPLGTVMVAVKVTDCP